jgi:hypothetical protein
MSARWIQNPRNGMARIEPRMAMIDPFDRFLFVTPVLFTALGFFMCGMMPIEVLGGIAASCFVGDAMILIGSLFRVDVRPPATVTRMAPMRR